MSLEAAGQRLVTQPLPIFRLRFWTTDDRMANLASLSTLSTAMCTKRLPHFLTKASAVPLRWGHKETEPQNIKKTEGRKEFNRLTWQCSDYPRAHPHASY